MCKLEDFLNRLVIPPPANRKRPTPLPMPMSTAETESRLKRWEQDVAELNLQKMTEDCVQAERQVQVLSKKVQSLENEKRVLKARLKLMSDQLKRRPVAKTVNQTNKRHKQAIQRWRV